MANKNEWVNGVGTINKSKSGNLYINIDIDEIVLKKGDRLTLTKKTDNIDRSVEAGKITEERAEELKEKLHFIKYDINKAPSNDL